MSGDDPLLVSQPVVRICLCLVAAITIVIAGAHYVGHTLTTAS